MENEKPQQSDKTNNNQVEPVNKTSAAPSLGISGGMKVIQPLDRNLKVEPMPIKPTPSTTSSIDETNTKAEQPTDSNLHSEKVPLNPSSNILMQQKELLRQVIKYLFREKIK